MTITRELRDALGRMWPSPELLGVADRIDAEHGRLRELLQQCVNEQLDTCGDCWGGLCEDCCCWLSEHADELRELGIEVGR